METSRSKGSFKFIFFTLLGILVVLIPFNFNGTVDTILFYYLKSFVKNFNNLITYMVVIAILLSAILSLIHLVCPLKFIEDHRLMNKLFSTTPFYVLNRIIGAIIAVMVLYQVGPQSIISPDTGGSMLGLATQLSVLVPMMLLLQTFILEFGGMEFIGELVGKVMRPLFKVSEICAVNIISAWVGPGNAAIMGTQELFEKGYFTVKEVATIGSQFAIGSIGWIVLVSSVLDVIDYLGVMLIGLTVVGIIVGFISVRIPPVSNYPDNYVDGSKESIIKSDNNKNALKRGLDNAILRANSTSLKNFTSKIENMSFYVFWLTPIIVSWGTIALIISLYTPILAWISLPIEWILNLFHVQDAAISASAIMSGLADNYLPVILGQNIQSAESRFIIAAMSIIQIIYLSETATLLTSTNKHMKFSHVIVIFLERTLIALPFVIIIAKLFVH